MSYTLCLTMPPLNTCPTCGHTPEADVDDAPRLNNDSPTYNYSQMIRCADELAGGDGLSFDAIHNKVSTEAVRWFRIIHATMLEHRETIEPLQPENGWGTYASLVECFEEYVAACERWPAATWTQCGASVKEGARCCAGWTT
jgi:hypothetical protein